MNGSTCQDIKVLLKLVWILSHGRIKVGFPPSLTVMAIAKVWVPMYYFFDILPMSAKKDIIFYVPVDMFFFSTLKNISTFISKDSFKTHT